MGTPSADITGDTLGTSSIPSGSSDILLPLHHHICLCLLTFFHHLLRDLILMFLLILVICLRSILSPLVFPLCAVKEVSQEDIDMALFGFTSSVPVARKEITQQDIDEALFGP